MKKVILTLFSLEEPMFNSLSAKAKKNYISAIIIFVFALVVYSVVGIELAYTIFGLKGLSVLWILVPYTLIIGAFDLLLLRGAFPRPFRAVFSLALSLLSTVCAMMLIAREEVETKFKLENQTRLTALAEQYDAAKQARYAPVYELEEQIARYHAKSCEPEAHRLYAGPLYERNHKHCLDEEQKVRALRSELDRLEEPYLTQYEEQRATYESIQNLGFFDRVEATYDVVRSRWVLMVIALVLFIVFLCLELALLFASRTLEDREMQKLWADDERLTQERNEAFLRQQHEELMAGERLQSEIRKQQLEERAERTKSFTKLSEEVHSQVLSQRIMGELAKYKDQMSPEVYGEIETRIAALRKHIAKSDSAPTEPSETEVK